MFVIGIAPLNIYALQKGFVQPVFSLKGEPAYNMIEDNDGFLWFSTMFDGLARFDGTNVKNIRSAKDKISNNFVSQLFIDSRNDIWIGTNNGLNRYNKQTETIKQFYRDSDKPKTSLADNTFNMSSNTIVEDHLGFLWFGTQNGLSRFDPHTELFKSYWQAKNLTNKNSVWSLFIDSKKFLWIATSGSSVVRLDVNTMESIIFSNDDDAENYLPLSDVKAINEDNNGNLWFVSRGNGIARYDPLEKKFVKYDFDQLFQGMDNYDFFDLKKTKNGRFVLISSNSSMGLVYFNPETLQVEQIKSQGKFHYSLRTDFVRSFFEDSRGVSWIVHNNGLVDKISPKGFTFDLYLANPDNKRSLHSNAVIPIYEDKKGNTWLGLFGSGLQKYHRESDSFSHYFLTSNEGKRFKNQYPTGFFEDDDGNFYISSFDGLLEFDRETLTTTRQITKDTSFYTMLADPLNKNIIWANGWEMGFNRINLQTGEIKQFLPNIQEQNSLPVITSINFIQQRDNHDMMWLATWGGGLTKFNRETEKFHTYQHNSNDGNSIISNTVFDVVELANRQLWLATDRGLSLFNIDTEAFDNFTYSQDFPIGSIFNILVDKNNTLWMGTNRGIVHFNPNTKKIIQIYELEDGVHSYNFFPTGKGQSKDGTLWFGGFNGLTSFKPHDLDRSTKPVDIYLTDLNQNGEVVPVHTALEYLKEINITWKNNNFEFAYIALEHNNSKKTSYKYYLEGYDSNWFFADKVRQGRYSNLPGGSYLLHINATNHDGIWNPIDKQLTIRVNVDFPPWKSPVAYFFYLVTFVVFFWALVCHRTNVINKEKYYLSEQVDLQTKELQKSKSSAEKANNIKTEFLANMSHEIRTPMNAIFGYTEILMEDTFAQKNKKVYEQLSRIYSNGQVLLHIINDVLDISKLEAGKIVLEEEYFDFYDLILDIELLFETSAKKNNIRLFIDIDKQVPAFIKADRTRLYQVLVNLMSNAIKFTKNGSVSLSVKIKNEHNELAETNTTCLAIIVKDTGIGISEDKISKIFNAFEQVQKQNYSQYGGTGLGLSISKMLLKIMNGTIEVNSKVGVGTEFIIHLKHLAVKSQRFTNNKQNKQVSDLFMPKARILIADDVMFNREIVKSHLKNYPLEVFEAQDGEEVLVMVDRIKPDLILLDLRMPKLDGVSVAKIINQDINTKHIHILVLTASAQSAKELGLVGVCQGFVRKPIVKKELLKLISNTLMNLKSK